MANTGNRNPQSDTSKRGFASMSQEKVEEIASNGGTSSAEEAGAEGMAERGRKGGQVSSEQAGSEGMAERGRKGGQARTDEADSEE